MSSRILLGLCVGMGIVTSMHAETIAAGTAIAVRTDTQIDARDTGKGRVYPGVVDRDVYGSNNRIVIPRDSDVELMVRDTGNHTLALELEAIVIKGKRYSVVTYEVTKHGEDKDGVGANNRTAKHVGGGALLGTIVGAVAGGGKGAGIGALAGGAAGAIGQTVTRGSKVHVPAETVLTFQLQQPLKIVPDKAHVKDGQHHRSE
ncbi:MAG TPA: hypothetical protein VE621_04820, partial [Bryobacteraceae bacterium]|nr:hypothetical protein [Bryobacteraceae bacterium]